MNNNNPTLIKEVQALRSLRAHVDMMNHFSNSPLIVDRFVITDPSYTYTLQCSEDEQIECVRFGQGSVMLLSQTACERLIEESRTLEDIRDVNWKSMPFQDFIKQSRENSQCKIEMILKGIN